MRDRIKADGVLVAFAGHGIQFRGGDEAYFCPADARPDDKATLISLKEVYQALDGCEAQLKLLLSDACRNDPVAAVSRRVTMDVASVTRPQSVKPPGGVAALFSCSEGELAFENDTLKHGVFFHFIIQGLQGEADFNKDREVALEELTFFTKRRVLDFVRAEYDGLRQMPVLKGEVGGLPVLASLDRAKVNLPERPAPSQGETRLKTITNTIGMKLTLIPAGTCLMGSHDDDPAARFNEKPRTAVQITRSFYLGVHEVTQAQYQAVMGKNPSWYSATGGRKDEVAGRSTDAVSRGARCLAGCRDLLQPVEREGGPEAGLRNLWRVRARERLEGVRISAAHGGGMGVCLSGGDTDPLLVRRRSRESGRACLVQGQLGRFDPSRGSKARQLLRRS